MKENVKCAWDQYMDGAITYVEFVRVAIAAVTKEDVDGHNAPYAGLKSAVLPPGLRTPGYLFRNPARISAV